MVADLTLGKITALALADAVNPCALAVLTLVLIAILTVNPKQPKKVLFAGLSFIAAVYILYMVYGLILIHIFKALMQHLAVVKIYFYKALAVVAILLGLLNIKDSIRYKIGGFATEMPIFMRPKVKKLISRVTSPKGAFFIGILVTLFLLPCTIGPYLIGAGILSYLDILKTIPWLLYYNILFVLPMIIITLFIFFGYTTVKRVSGWKDSNIRLLHLIAGIIMLVLGIAMILGFI